MRSSLLASHFRALSKASALVFVAISAAACSNDASRLDEFITASTKVDKSTSASKKLAAPVAATAAPLASVAAQPLAPTVQRTDLPSVTETQVGPRALQTAAVAKAATNVPSSASVPAASGALVLAPRKKLTTPLQVASTDKLTTGAVVTPAPAPLVNEVEKPKAWDNSKGARITVKPGETLYNISRRYGVPVDAIMKANNITNADQVKSGSRILIPSYNYSDAAPVSAPDNNPTTRASRASRGFQGQAHGKVAVPKARAERPAEVVTAKPDLPKPSHGSSIYVVESGDSLYGIAKRKGVSAVALREANGMTGNDLKIGQKLNIPAYGSRKTIAQNKTVDTQNTGAISSNETKSSSNSTKYSAPTAAPSIKQKSSEKVASVAKTSATAFRWPAKGRIIGKFGEKLSTGTNDGIDISMPIGTPIKAAENGTVIYSGSELEDFGKLVLVSHSDGWVSAYAHSSSVLVRRGDKVKRGQVIAKSGRSGNATSPKLHFELRKNSNPVNPLKHLAK